MRANDNFNIITGEVKHNFQANTANRRFASLDVIRQLKQTQYSTLKAETNNLNSRKLGISRDHTQFQYSYLPKNNTFGATQPLNQQSKISQMPKNKQTQTASLINASKAGYNIVSHTTDFLGEANWNSTKKRNPVSKIRDLGHMHAANYRDKYVQDKNFSKKSSLCNNICEIQRSYGTQKFFRKFK